MLFFFLLSIDDNYKRNLLYLKQINIWHNIIFCHIRNRVCHLHAKNIMNDRASHKVQCCSRSRVLLLLEKFCFEENICIILISSQIIYINSLDTSRFLNLISFFLYSTLSTTKYTTFQSIWNLYSRLETCDAFHFTYSNVVP